MLEMKNVTETYGAKAFLENGYYLGDVEGVMVLGFNKVFGWRIKATRNSFLQRVLGSAKGVIVPHQLVKAIGDIFIVSKSAIPSYGNSEEREDM